MHHRKVHAMYFLEIASVFPVSFELMTTVNTSAYSQLEKFHSLRLHSRTIFIWVTLLLASPSTHWLTEDRGEFSNSELVYVRSLTFFCGAWERWLAVFTAILSIFLLICSFFFRSTDHSKVYFFNEQYYRALNLLHLILGNEDFSTWSEFADYYKQTWDCQTITVYAVAWVPEPVVMMLNNIGCYFFNSTSASKRLTQVSFCWTGHFFLVMDHWF